MVRSFNWLDCLEKYENYNCMKVISVAVNIGIPLMQDIYRIYI